MIDHVQLAKLDVVKLFVADVARVDGDNPAIVVLTGDNLHMVRIPKQFVKTSLINVTDGSWAGPLVRLILPAV